MERPPAKHGFENLNVGIMTLIGFGVAILGFAGTIVAFSVQVGAARNRLENLEARASQADRQSAQLAELQGDVRSIRENMQAMKEARAGDAQRFKDIDGKLENIGVVVNKICYANRDKGITCEFR